MNLPTPIKLSPFRYIVFSHEQFLAAAKEHWDSHPNTASIGSGIDQRTPPTSYPVAILFDIQYDAAGDEPQYQTADYLYTDIAKAIHKAELLYKRSQQEACVFSKIGDGRYIIHSEEGYRLATASFWKESGAMHTLNKNYVTVPPKRYPVFVTMQAEADDGIVHGISTVATPLEDIGKFI